MGRKKKTPKYTMVDSQELMSRLDQSQFSEDQSDVDLSARMKNLTLEMFQSRLKLSNGRRSNNFVKSEESDKEQNSSISGSSSITNSTNNGVNHIKNGHIQTETKLSINNSEEDNIVYESSEFQLDTEVELGSPDELTHTGLGFYSLYSEDEDTLSNEESSDSDSDDEIIFIPDPDTSKSQISKSMRRKLVKQKHKQKLKDKREKSKDNETFGKSILDALSKCHPNLPIYYSNEVCTLLFKINFMMIEFVGCKFPAPQDAPHQLLLPPMIGKFKEYVKRATHAYGLTCKGTGSGRSSTLIIYRQSQTKLPDEVSHSYLSVDNPSYLTVDQSVMSKILYDSHLRYIKFNKVNQKSFPLCATKAISKQSFKKGAKVGEHIAPISPNNIGYKLMQKMGWDPASDNQQELVVATIRNQKAGLGSDH